MSTRFEMFEDASHEGEWMDDVECWSRVSAQLETECDRLRQINEELTKALQLATNMRPALLMMYGAVPEPVLEYCNLARAALAKAKGAP